MGDFALDSVLRELSANPAIETEPRTEINIENSVKGSVSQVLNSNYEWRHFQSDDNNSMVRGTSDLEIDFQPTEENLQFAEVASTSQFANEPIKNARSLTPIVEWEGYIESIGNDDFCVRMVDVRSKSPLPTDHATFSKNDINEHDRQLLKEGAIVRWVIGRERLPTGEIRNVSELYFRQLPAHNELAYRRALGKAHKLLDGIVWDDSKSVNSDS